jgi:hypothetical protein
LARHRHARYDALDPSPSPDFFTVIFSPYSPAGSNGAFATLLWKKLPSIAWTPPAPVPAAESDLTRLLSALIPEIDNTIDKALIGEYIG